MRIMIATLAAALFFAGCSGGTQPAAGSSDTGGSTGSAEVIAVDNEFEPTELALTPGEEVTVTFTNNGETVHTFTSEELGFDTGNVEAGDSAEVTFTAPDEESPFVCTLHEASDMVGTITVE